LAGPPCGLDFFLSGFHFFQACLNFFLIDLDFFLASSYSSMAFIASWAVFMEGSILTSSVLAGPPHFLEWPPPFLDWLPAFPWWLQHVPSPPWLYVK
jgi:hypothetical protein